jgi:GNAT superfamily N-acetyltransferase
LSAAEPIGGLSVRVLPDPERGPVTPDGPLRSVQEAELAMDAAALEQLWRPETLERLARGYWRYLNQISLGLLRIAYSGSARSIVVVWRRFELLRFRAPRYDTGPGFGRVTWPIERGVLVAPGGRGRGYLSFDVRRAEAQAEGEGRVRVRAVVSNFYPLLRGSGRFARIGGVIYSQTQLRVHVLVTRGYLRSLERGDLPPLRPEREQAYRETAP